MSDTSLARFRRYGGWSRPVALPEAIDTLDGPVHGIVTLPLRVFSSGAGPAQRFDLDDEMARRELYEIVLTEGTVEDVQRLLNVDELRRLWAGLYLPPHVRHAWESRFGELAA
jgi:hypothetical protein